MSKILTVILINFLFIACISDKEGVKTDIVLSQLDKNIVQTIYGKVRGYRHNQSYIFKGIPYAKAERFMPPTEPDSWEGIRSSMDFGPICPQNLDLRTDEIGFLFRNNVSFPNENCLRLNVWTPGINDGKKRPVMVWLHGGGFSSGYGHILQAFEGENINKNGDVLLVTVNHRLNVLGFLNLSDFGDKYRYSGNVGIMDLVAALQWINKNIAQFGGDPCNVTIFGQSGGGGKVTALLDVPSAQRLFHKAIIESGARTYFSERKYSKMIGQGVLKQLGLKPSQVDELQKIPYETLLATGEEVIRKLNNEIKDTDVPLYNSRFAWNPCVDGEFMPYHPTDKEVLTLNSNVSIIIGSNKNEFLSINGNANLTALPNMDEVKRLLKEKYGDKADEYIELVKKTYPDDLQPIDFLNIDTAYRSRALGLAAHRAKTNPVYMYFFKWNSPALDGKYQSHHSLELPFAFSNVEKLPELTGGGKDAFELERKMGLAWINFARTGDPNHKGLPRWPTYSEENGATMIFDNKCEVINHHDKELLDYVAKF